MLTAFVIWLGLQIPLVIAVAKVGKRLKVGIADPGLTADGMRASSIDDRSLKKAA